MVSPGEMAGIHLRWPYSSNVHQTNAKALDPAQTISALFLDGSGDIRRFVHVLVVFLQQCNGQYHHLGS
jgi:hypothetical protein